MNEEPYQRCKSMLASMADGQRPFLIKRWRRLFAQCSQDEQQALLARLEAIAGSRARGDRA